MKILLVLSMVAAFGLRRAARPCALRGDSFKPLPIAMLLWRGWFMRAARLLSFADIVLREWIHAANISSCCQWRNKWRLPVFAFSGALWRLFLRMIDYTCLPVCACHGACKAVWKGYINIVCL